MRYDLYVITDEMVAGGRSHLHVAEKCLKNGANVLQLRDVSASSEELLDNAKRLRELTKGTEMRLIICDDLKVALDSGADGVHIYKSKILVKDAREQSPAGFIIGMSVSNVSEGLEAQSQGADYVIFGPLYQSQIEDLGPVYGLEDFQKFKKAMSIPVVAIGGIKLFNAGDVIKAGADGVAVKSGALHQRDIGDAVKLLVRSIANAKKE